MIRLCRNSEKSDILKIINDSSQAYKGHIPNDCYHEPYFTEEYFDHEISDGVIFWGFEDEGTLAGVMGIQDVEDVTLIRHAYVKTSMRNRGIGNKLIEHLLDLTKKPVLIGTWKDAVWAIHFYKKFGFNTVSEEEKNHLLRKYWKISDRQVETSVVLKQLDKNQNTMS